MAKNYTLPTDQNPTFWNIDAAVGLTIGSLLGGIGAPIGAIIGGFMGKSRMQNERENGIETSEPSFWNKGFVAGWSLGQLATLPIVAVGAVVGLPLEALLGVSLLGWSRRCYLWRFSQKGHPFGAL